MGRYFVDLEVIERRSVYVDAKDEREASEKVLKQFTEDYEEFDDEAYFDGVELHFKEVVPCVKFRK